MTEQDLFNAIKEFDNDLLRQVLQDGVSPNCLSDSVPFLTPLVQAIDPPEESRSAEAVSLLIDAGANVNSWDKLQRYHPLLVAIAETHQEVIALLFAAGVDPDSG